MTHHLTHRQAEVLLKIAQLTVPRGPTVRELAAALGIKSSCTAYRYIERLTAKGLVRHDGASRSAVLTPAGQALMAAAAVGCSVRDGEVKP